MKYPILYGHQIQDWANRKVSHVVDVGGHLGGSALTLWYIFQPKRVFVYEPVSYEVMKTNIAMVPDIWPMPYAVSDEAGFIELGTRKGVLALYSNRLKGGRILRKWAVTLDEKDHPCDYLKIDVEGMEMNVLRGAKNTIRKNKPLIQVEMKYDKDIIMQHLDEIGYTMEMEIEKDGFFRFTS